MIKRNPTRKDDRMFCFDTLPPEAQDYIVRHDHLEEEIAHAQSAIDHWTSVLGELADDRRAMRSLKTIDRFIEQLIDDNELEPSLGGDIRDEMLKEMGLY